MIINQNTQRLIKLAQSGDQQAKEHLFAVYWERVRRIVRLRMGQKLRSKYESMDFAQDAVLSALEGLDNFTYKNEGDFLRWLARIAENRIRDGSDRLHTQKRDIDREIHLDTNDSYGKSGVIRGLDPVHSPTPSHIISKREQLDRLEEAVDSLKPEHREVIVLIKLEGLSYKDTANKLGKTPDSMRMLLCRAMAALSQIYEVMG